ncbi:MAG: universal stress protein [Bdellovibrionales bacterium]|nr:universal stress protein [Bdellovibrionales bacterium]
MAKDEIFGPFIDWYLNLIEKDFSVELTPQTIKEKEFVNAVWAIDPYEQKMAPHKSTLKVIARLLGGGFSKVHPIYVCPKSDQGLGEARNQMQNFMMFLDLGDTEPFHVYSEPSSDRSERVEKVLNIAHEHNAKVVLLTSHGRSSLGATFLGSFARDLLNKSDIPIIFINPHTSSYVVSDKVMFATDFSEQSKVAFQEFLNLVRGKTSEIILCHVLSFPYEYVDAYGMSMPLLNYYREDQKEWAEREAQRWIKEAEGKDINIRLNNIMEESLSAPAHSIKAIAEREKVALIGLVSHVGPIEKLVIGSVTRDLMSSQKFNLWVCGPRFGS